MANPNDLRSLEKDPRLFLYTSLTAGSSHIITATSRLETILKANRIPFQAVDIATDEQARKLWQRRAGKKKLPGLVKEGFIIGDYDEVEEWNEYGELKENIGPLPTGAAVGVAPKILPIKPTATAGSANVTPAAAAAAAPKSQVDMSRMVALPGAAEIAARNNIVHKSKADEPVKADEAAKTEESKIEEPVKAEKMTAAPDEKEKSIEKAIKSAGDDKQGETSDERTGAEKESKAEAEEPSAEEKTTGSAAIKPEEVASLAQPSVAAEPSAQAKTEPIVAESAGATTIPEAEKASSSTASKETSTDAVKSPESETVAPLSTITNAPLQRRSTLTKSPPDTAIGENIVPSNVAAAADLKDQKEKAAAVDSSVVLPAPAKDESKLDTTKDAEVDPETVEPAAEEGSEAQPTPSIPVADASGSKSAEGSKIAATASSVASTDVGIPADQEPDAAKEGAAIFNQIRNDALSKSSNTVASPTITAFKDISSAASPVKTDAAKEHNGAQVKFAPEPEIKKVEEKMSIPEEKDAEAGEAEKPAAATTTIASTIASTVQAAVTTTKEVVEEVVKEVKAATVESKSEGLERESKTESSESAAKKSSAAQTQEQPAADAKSAEKSVED